MKAEFHKIDIDKLVDVPNSLNNLKTKVNDLDVGKLKTVPIYLKKLSDVVNKQVVKNTKLNTLKTKENNLEKKFPEANTLIHINQYQTDKQNLKKKLKEKKEKKMLKKTNTIGLVITTVLNTNTNCLVKKTYYHTKICEIEKKITDHDHSKYITTQEFNKFKQQKILKKE